MAALPGKQVVVEEVSEDESDSGGPAEFERTITGDPEVALAAAQRAIHRAAQRVFGEGLGGKGPSLPMRPATAAQRNGAASDEDVPDLVADDSSNSSSEWDTDEGLSEEELHDSPPTPNKPGAAKGDKAAPNAGFKSASGSRAAPDMASQMEAAQRAYEAQQERDRAFKQTRAAQANQARLDMERRERERAQREEARERAREAKRQRKMARAMQGGAQQAEASSRETPEEREARRQLLEKARMLNAQHDAEERKRLRKELGLDDEEGEGGEAELVLARCALRPGTMGDAKCEADPEGYAIKGHDKYMKIDCSEGCHIAYHWGCWRKVESHLRTAQPDFSWKNKTALACFTDGCSGSITYAITLEGPNGSRSRHEVYKRQAEPSAPSAAAVANDQPDRQAKRREKLGKRGSKNRAGELADAAQADSQTAPAASAASAPTPATDASAAAASSSAAGPSSGPAASAAGSAALKSAGAAGTGAVDSRAGPGQQAPAQDAEAQPQAPSLPVTLPSFELPSLDQMRAVTRADSEDELAVGKGKGKKLKKRKEKAPKKEVIVLGAASHFSRAPPATPLSPPRPPGPPHIPSHPPHAPPQPHKAAPVAAADPGAAAPRVAEFPTLDMAQELLAKGVSTFSMDPVVAALEQLKVVDEAVATAMVLVECLDVRRIEERGGGQTVEGFLLELFSAHGHVLHLRAFKPQEAAAVEFETEKEAVRAMMHLHDMKVERRPIKLCYLHSFPSQQLMDTLLAEAEQASQQAQRTQQQPQEHYYYHDEHQWDAGQADGSQHWTDWGHEPGYGNGQSVPVNIPQDHLGAHKDAFGGVDLSPMNKPIRTARPASLAGSASDTSSLAKPHLKVTAKEFVPGSSFGSTGSWDAMGGASGVLGLVHQSAAQGNGEVGSVVEAGAAAESGAPAIAPAGEAAKAALLAKRLSIAAPEFKPSLLSREVKAAGLNGAEGSGGVGASGVGADVGDGESSEMGAKVSSISAEANTSMGNGILAGEPSSKQPAAGLAGVQWTGAQLIRCNAESLAIYRSKQSFGIRFADLVDAEAVCKLDTVALVLYHVHTHELHGVWKSRGVVQVDKQGIPIISFRPLKELPALASAVVTHLLKSNANGDVVVPQYLDATKTAALMEAFCPATGAAENDASTTAQAGPPDQPSRKAVDASGGVQPDSAPAAGKATSDSRDGEVLEGDAQPAAASGSPPSPPPRSTSLSPDTPSPSSRARATAPAADGPACPSGQLPSASSSSSPSPALSATAAGRASSPSSAHAPLQPMLSQLEADAELARRLIEEDEKQVLEQTGADARLAAELSQQETSSPAKPAAAEPAAAPAPNPMAALFSQLFPAEKAGSTPPAAPAVSSGRGMAPNAAVVRPPPYRPPPYQPNGLPSHGSGLGSGSGLAKVGSTSSLSELSVRSISPALSDRSAGAAAAGSASRSGTLAASASGGTRRAIPQCRICGEHAANYILPSCKHWGPCTTCVPDSENVHLYPTCRQCNKPTTKLIRVYMSA